jgi:hypothetical protein
VPSAGLSRCLDSRNRGIASKKSLTLCTLKCGSGTSGP